MRQHRTYGRTGCWSLLQRRQGGFTMIELLITITIIGLVLMFGMPSMSSWLQSNQIRSAAESVQSGLLLARSEAVRRNTNVQFTLSSLAGTGAPDWSVTCATPAVDCPGAGMSETEIRKYSAQEGAPSTQVASPQATITFSGVGRVTPLPGTTMAINISNPHGGACAASAGPMRCLRIQVSPGGQIKMCDPALPVTNPRGC